MIAKQSNRLKAKTISERKLKQIGLVAKQTTTFTCLVANAFPPNMAALAELIDIQYEKKYERNRGNEYGFRYSQ